MNTILVVVDFNETSKNCALYAIQLAQQLRCSNIVLYHRFQVLNVANPLAGFDQVSSETYAAQSITDFEAFKNTLGNIPESINIKMYHGAIELIESIEQMIDTVGADLVVMGIEHQDNWLKEKFATEEGLNVAALIKVPVILVPPQYQFEPIDKVLFLTDLEKVASTTPVENITNFLQTANVNKLNIVHIAHEHNEKQKHILEHLFNNTIEVAFHLVNDEFNHAVDNFKNEQGVDLVIAISKEHSIWSRLFGNSHTKHLTNVTQIPILLTHK